MDILEVKKSTTIEEQIKLLKNRNLIVDDIEVATKVLNNVNYYRITGYLLPYKIGNVYKEGISFDDIYTIYMFDKKLRNLLLMILESIEISIRAHISNYLGIKYGALCYKESSNFLDEHRHSKLMQSLDMLVKRSKNDIMVKHNIIKYGDLPIRSMLEISTFKTLSELYSNMKNKDKKELCKEYYNNDVKPPLMVNWLHVITHIRNICAHFGRLYSRDINVNIKIPYKYKEYNLADNRLFAVLIAIKYLAPNKDEYRDFVAKLAKIITKAERVDIAMLGFPNNWYEILIKNN